jgi:glutamyl-tRNA reductase
MRLYCVGINHKTAPIEIRERFYLDQTERELFLSQLKNSPEVEEAFVVSTCNRTEIYALALECQEEALIRQLCAVKKQTCTLKIKDNFYAHSDTAAIQHLLSVASGLDSLVIGEKEILGQLKDAIELARQKRFLGRYLNILANTALRTGKLARSATAIGRGGLSVSWAAVEEAKVRLSTLQGRSIMVIGAGKMSQLAAADLKRKGLEHLYIVNRTKEKGETLAKRFNGIATDFSQIRELLTTVDVCICSASAPHYLLEKALLEECMAGRSNGLILIDISMPRNIDPRAAHIQGITLIGLDELDQVVAANEAKRANAVVDVEAIISKKMTEFHKKLNPDRFVADKETLMKKTIMAAMVMGAMTLSIGTSHANVKQLKTYREVYPDYKPGCVYCHLDEKPKKEDGQHELNAYGMKLKELMNGQELTADMVNSVGKHEDFKAEETQPAAETDAPAAETTEEK